jgi:hypothetical protein
MKCRPLIPKPAEFGERGVLSLMGSVFRFLSNHIRVAEESRGKGTECDELVPEGKQ